MHVENIYLAAWRKHKDWTQTTLARSSGLTQATISRMEDRIQKPGLTTLSKLASALGIGLDKLLVDPQSGKARGLSRFQADRIAKAIVTGKYPKLGWQVRICRDMALWIGEKLHAQGVAGWKKISRQRVHATRRAVKIKQTYAPPVLQQILWRVNKVLAGGLYEIPRHR